MAPPTRTNPLRTPSPIPLAGKEGTTLRRCRFFDALTHNPTGRSLRSISKDAKISEKTGRNWKAEWLALGENAKRRQRKPLQVLGRKSRISKATCKMLVSPLNPVRKQPLEAQIEYFNLPI